jgi:hypothetical protein
MANKEVAGVTLNNTSLAVKLGLPLGNFFKEIGSTVSAWLAKGLINLKNLARNMIDGAKELGKAILRGDWNLFKSWLKEDPIAVSAGVGAVILIGGVVVGGVVSGIAALASRDRRRRRDVSRCWQQRSWCRCEFWQPSVEF